MQHDVDWEQEGLIAVRDGIRAGIALMPTGCEAARSFQPLLVELAASTAAYEHEQRQASGPF